VCRQLQSLDVYGKLLGRPPQLARRPAPQVTALRFLLPITAPTPVRPAARPSLPSLIMEAYRTRFSPAVPTLVTAALGSVSSRRAASIAYVSVPHRWRASRSSTLVSVTTVQYPKFYRYPIRQTTQ